MSTSIKEIAWIAGLLEGEGSFGLTNNGKSPCIWLSMTDVDTVQKVRDVIDKSKSIAISIDSRKESYKDQYKITFNGSKAVAWMMTIYPLMSIRRQARIRECLNAWKLYEIDSRFVNSQESKAISSLTRRLKNLGYSEFQINIARNMKRMKFADDKILIALNELENTSSDSVN